MANAEGETISGVLRRNWEPTVVMLRRAIEGCPEEAWAVEDGNLALWEHAFHAVVWVDVWLRVAGEKWEKSAIHCDAAVGMKPGAGPVISREEMLGFLEAVLARRGRFLEALTDEVLLEHDGVMGAPWTRADRLLGQIRHVQHHVGCMSAILRRRTGKGVDWAGWGE